MKISTKGRYGLKAMVDLAVNSSEEECISLKSIAQRQNISESYLEQLIATLKKAGFVKSVRGANGGYVINVDPKKTTVGEILEKLEGKVEVVECTSSDKGCKSGNCSKCVTKSVWDKINSSVNDVVNSITLDDLASQLKEILD